MQRLTRSFAVLVCVVCMHPSQARAQSLEPATRELDLRAIDADRVELASRPISAKFHRSTDVQIHGLVLPNGASVELWSTQDTLRPTGVVADSDGFHFSMQVLDTVTAPYDLIVHRPIDPDIRVSRVVYPDPYEFTLLVDGQVPPVEEAADSCLGGPNCPHPGHSPLDAFAAPSLTAFDGAGCSSRGAHVSTTTFDYYVTRFGNMAKNCSISLTITPIIYDAAGHCHGSGTHPVGDPSGTIFRTTDANGVATITHTLPDVSGIIQIVANVVFPCDTIPFVEGQNFFIGVRAPTINRCTAGLYPMPPGPGYVFTTPGPDNMTRHPDYRYATPAMIAMMQALAVEWATLGANHPPLQYNDMSLMWGGLFDIQESGTPRPPDWTPPHCGHRKGNACDITHDNLSWGQLHELVEWIAGGVLKAKKGTHVPTNSQVLKGRAWVGPEGNHWHVQML